MCTILIAWRCLSDAAYILTANRDELVARPAAAPARISDAPRCYGGRDLLAGGTWLAVRADGCVAAVTNRRRDDQDEVMRDPARRSRGELPLLLLTTPRGEIEASLRRIRPDDYNPFNLVLVDHDRALVAHGVAGEQPQIVELQPGTHLLCVHDVDDSAHPKELRLRRELDAAVRDGMTAAQALAAMTRLLQDHTSESADGRDAPCIHGEEYGTVSASRVVQRGGQAPLYSHAPGRPCVTPFDAVVLD